MVVSRGREQQPDREKKEPNYQRQINCFDVLSIGAANPTFISKLKLPKTIHLLGYCLFSVAMHVLKKIILHCETSTVKLTQTKEKNG